MRLALTILLVSSCFQPTYPEGRACTPGGECPGDLICDPGTFTCRSEGNAIDAAADSAIPADAAIDAIPVFPCIEGDLQAEDPLSGNCYIYLATAEPWADAQDSCVAVGPDVLGAGITSAEENAFIQAFIPEAETWTGGNDLDAEGTFTWTSGEPFVFENWRNGNPDNGSGNEDCLSFQANQSGRWDDKPCSQGRPVICERAAQGSSN